MYFLANADALSRRPYSIAALDSHGLQTEQIKQHQHCDPELADILRYLQTQQLVEDDKKAQALLLIIDDCYLIALKELIPPFVYDWKSSERSYDTKSLSAWAHDVSLLPTSALTKQLTNSVNETFGKACSKTLRTGVKLVSSLNGQLLYRPLQPFISGCTWPIPGHSFWQPLRSLLHRLPDELEVA